MIVYLVKENNLYETTRTNIKNTINDGGDQ
jgi:hypothetical protein